ncbi:MAG: F0F1 ATP synthase subunit B [Phycisphaerae bacterium]
MKIAPNKKRLAKVFLAVYIPIVLLWFGHAILTTKGAGRAYRLGPDLKEQHLTEPFEVRAVAGRTLDEDLARILKRAGATTVVLETGREVLVDNGLDQVLRSVILPKDTHITENLYNLVLADEARQRPDAVAYIRGRGKIMGFSLDLAMVVLNFLGLLCLLYVFFWDPLLEMLDRRAETVRSQLHEAKTKRGEALGLRDRYAGLIEGAKKEREQLIEGGEREAEAERRKTLDRARQEAEKVLERARQEIEGEAAQAKRQLRREVAGLSADIAAEILRRELRPEDHKALVQDFLDKADAPGGDGKPPQGKKGG